MTKVYKNFVLFLLFFSSVAFAQKYTVTGTVTDAANGEKLVGANVYVKGTTIGAASDANGVYKLTLDKGSYTIVCSYVGFERVESKVNVTNNMTLDFPMKEHEFSLSVTVLADRAKERETPVAFTNVDKKDMEFKLGSRDVPMVLNTTPSVYATQQGGGAGDARVNVRGFNQRNVAIMINGVPVNDMENGWVYWSNWDGVGDATSSIQVQRGLSAVNLATPSIGGTMNIVTDPTAAKPGYKLKQEFGNANFRKTTVSANTGLVNGKYAMSATIVRKTGDGFIDKTWTDAWAYYFGASYNINDKNRIELYALGAPQFHGQNLYKQNIAAYSHEFAKELGYSQAALDKFPQASAGRFYNENWNSVSSSYNGHVYYNESLFFGSKSGPHQRYNPTFINERENFFHKPIVNLNWYSQFSKKFSLYTTAYWSGGTGGGTGTLGHIVWDYSGPSRVANWDATIARNDTSSTGSLGILRNSRNDQWTWGIISKAYYKVNDNIKTSFGIDGRIASIDHYREVRDLLGGSYYLDNSDQFHPNRQTHLGDKIAYNNTNDVSWLGAYAQGEYTKDLLTAYATAGWSMIKYNYTDHFRKGDNGGERNVATDFINGYQFKGGASYRATQQVDVFANAGYVSKVPIFDQVIDDRTGTKAAEPKNEKFISFEAGVNYTGLDGALTLKGNFYYTTWKDRANSISVRKANGDEALIFLQGVDSRHSGLEFEGAYQSSKYFRLDAAASFGNWKYTDDVQGTFKDYNDPNTPNQNFNYYIKDLKVGDAPQTQLALSATVFPFKGFSAQLVYKFYDNFYADWEPTSRTDPTDRGQSWKAPSYSLVDLHATLNLFNLGGTNFQIFGHIFNLFDKIYVQDAVDNSRFNAYRVNHKIVHPHQADAAEVFLGLPRSFNLGISVRY